MANELIKYYDSTYDDVEEVYLIAPLKTLSSTRQFVAVDAFEDVHTTSGTYSYYLDLSVSGGYSSLINYINYFGNGLIVIDGSFRYNCCYYGVYYNSSEQRLYLDTFSPQVGDYYFWLPTWQSSIGYYSMLSSIGDGIWFTSYYFNEGTNRQIYKVKPLWTSSSAGYTYTALPDNNRTGAICIGNTYGNLSVNPDTGGGWVDDLDTEFEIANVHIGSPVNSNYFIDGYYFKSKYVTTNSAFYKDQCYAYDFDDEYYYRQGEQVNNILQYEVSSSNKRILKTSDLMGLYNPAGTAISAGSSLGTNSRFTSYTYDIGTTPAAHPTKTGSSGEGLFYIRKWTSGRYTNYTVTFWRYQSDSWTSLGNVDLRNGSTQNAVAFWTYSKVGTRYRAIDRLIYMGSDGRVWLTSGTQSSTSLVPTSKAQAAAIPYKMV